MKRLLCIVFVLIFVCMGYTFAEEKVYQIGNYIYSVPETWSEKDYSGDQHFSNADGLFYSVALMASPDDKQGEKSESEIISDMFNRISVLISDAEIVPISICGLHAGYIASGSSAIIDDSFIEAAFLINDPGYIQVVYENPGSSNQAEEFIALLDRFYLHACQFAEY